MNRWNLLLAGICLVTASLGFAYFQGYSLLGEICREGPKIVTELGWPEAAYDFHVDAALVFGCIVAIALFGIGLAVTTFLNRERRQKPQPTPQPTRPPNHRPNLRLI